MTARNIRAKRVANKDHLLELEEELERARADVEMRSTLLDNVRRLKVPISFFSVFCLLLFICPSAVAARQWAAAGRGGALPGSSFQRWGEKGRQSTCGIGNQFGPPSP